MCETIAESLQPGAVLDVLMETHQDRFVFRADRGCNNHAVGIEAPQFPRLKIRNDHDLTPNERFRCVSQSNPRQHLPLLESEVNNETQKFVRTLYPFGFDNGWHAQINFRKVFDRNLGGEVSRFGHRGRSFGFCFRFLLGQIVHLLQHLFWIQAWEQRRTTANVLANQLVGPTKVTQTNASDFSIQPKLFPQTLSGLRNNWGSHRRDQAQSFGSMEQNTVEPLRFGRPFCYCPRLILDDVLVHARNQLPDIFKTAREVVIVEVLSIAVGHASSKFTHLGVALGATRRWNAACAVL